MSAKRAEKIANALSEAYRGRRRGASEAVVALAEIAATTKMSETEVRDLVVRHMNLIWGRLPFGTSLKTNQDGTITVYDRLCGARAK